MSDRSDDSEFSPYNAAPIIPALRKPSWTPEQIVRIDYEWRRLQRNFAYHPDVRVIPLEGEPPTQYQFEYRLRTLGYNEAGQLDYLPSCSVTIELPNAFPHAAPIVRPTASLFHPNISEEAQQIAIIPDWTSGNTLEDVLTRVGLLLAFQSYDPHNVWNPVAMQWVVDNRGYLPTDATVNLAPENGGDPVERIRRAGPVTLRQLRDQVNDICASMLDVGDPTGADVRQFARRTRLAVSLFQASDLPKELSASATELQEWAAQLPLAAPTFEALRTLKANTAMSLEVEGELTAAITHLAAQLAALEKMVSAAPATDPFETMRQIPAPSDLQTAMGVLRGLLTAADQRLTMVKEWLPSLHEPQRGKTFTPLLQTSIDAEAFRQTGQVEDARTRLNSTLQRATPLVERTRLEIAALEQLELWKEFSELTEKGHSLVMRAEGWGSASIQAYFVSMGEESYGPFEFEQVVDLGSASLAVRNTAQRTIDLIDVHTGRRISTGESGEIQFDVPGENPPETFPATFQLTSRCDELWLQLDYVIRQTQGLLARAAVRSVETPSWCGRYTTALAHSAGKVTAEYRATITHWIGLSADLKAVGAFKERVATYYLVKRIGEKLPQYSKERATAVNAANQSTSRIAEILSRGSKEMVSGQIVIPARLHKEYGERLDLRERAELTIARIDKLLRHASTHLRARTGSRTLYGLAAVPELRVLSPLPDELVQISGEMSDQNMTGMLATLGAAMGVDLRVAEHPSIAPRHTAAPPTVPAGVAPPRSITAPVPQPKPLAAAPPALYDEPVTASIESEVSAQEAPPLGNLIQETPENFDTVTEAATNALHPETELAHVETPTEAQDQWHFAEETVEPEDQTPPSDDIFGDWPASDEPSNPRH